MLLNFLEKLEGSVKIKMASSLFHVHACVCVCGCACVRACVCACVRACLHACVPVVCHTYVYHTTGPGNDCSLSVGQCLGIWDMYPLIPEPTFSVHCCRHLSLFPGTCTLQCI